MKKHFIMAEAFFSTANRMSIKNMIGLLVLILCLGIANAWGAPPAAILYVDASASPDGDGMSWENAFNDLQDALIAAASGDQIWVAAGTYKPSRSYDNSDDPRTAAFILKSGLKIYGGFAGDENQLQKRQVDPILSVLSGDIGISDDDTDNSYHVVYAVEVTGAVLDGFTVTGGRDEGHKVNMGAGMYNKDSSLTVANCTFSDNKVAVTTEWADGLGAGMYNHNSAPIVTKCTFNGNQAGNALIYATGRGGGMYNEGGFVTDENDTRFPLVTGCNFSDNVASSKVEFYLQYGGGGGMYNNDCNLTVDSCTFTGNLGGNGGGMFNFYGMPTITNCIFDTNSNTSEYGVGGAIYDSTHGTTILNCTFYQNGWRLIPEGDLRPNTKDGGAIYEVTKGSDIDNCIFIKNGVINSGGAIVPAISAFNQTAVTNCLFYENISWQGWNKPVDVVINHVTGNIDYSSVNNLYDIDPLLEDPAGGDFHLRYDSPCIDAGYSLKRGYLTYPYPSGLSTIDFEGDNRIIDGDGNGVPTVDIGVDEFVPNLPDLGWFIQALADTGEIEQAVADRLLAYSDAAQAALDREDKETAVSTLNALIADAWASLEDTGTAQVIEMKTLAVIEEMD